MQSDQPRQNQSFDAGASTTVTSAFGPHKGDCLLHADVVADAGFELRVHMRLQLLHGQPGFCRQMAASSLA